MAKVGPVQIVAFAVAASAVACSVDVRGSEVSTHEEKRFTVSTTEPVELKLRTFDGTLVVRSWDKNEVLVEIERRAPDQAAAEALVVNQTQDGNKITIEAPTTENRRSVSFGVSQSVNFSVTLPRRVALEASTGDGGIDVSDLQGTIDLNSGDGRIVASHLDGQVKVHTGDGTIRIDQAAGKVDADSGDGSVEVTGRLDELAVRTGDGPVRVDASNGSAMKNDWRITTGDGRISLRVPSDFNASVDASTGDGTVRVDGIDRPRTGDESERRRVVGQLGSGGATLHLRSGDGSIDVTR
jgi:DUF4097 and DUF4098 domain-containing protein YvlB